MSTAAAIVSDRAAQPDLTRAWARASATLNAFAYLLTLVFNLTGHAKTLARAFRVHVRQPGYGRTGRFFGTAIIPVISKCMRRGVMRGMALYKVLWRRACRRPSTRLPALQRDRTPSGQGGANARAGTAAAHDAPAKAALPKWRQACDLSHLLAEPAVAEAARRRVAGAILPGIDLDFANTAESAGASWDNLLVPIARFGGSLNQFIAEVDRRKAPASRIETPRFGVPPEHHRPDCLLAEEQSCNRAPPQQESAECSSPEFGPCPETCEAFVRTETAPALRWPVSPAREVAATPTP
jgi:hypothetical protein